MPIIKSAKKKVRQDKKRTIRNNKTRSEYKKAFRIARSKTTQKNLNNAYKKIDTAQKKGVIHKNKASRLKRRAARHAKGKPSKNTK